MTMKFRSFQALLVIAACAGTMSVAAAATANRTFTQKEGGKTLQGHVTGVNSAQGTVTLRLDGGRTVTFKPEILVDEDVEYIKEWAQKNAIASRVSLSATREVGTRDKINTGNIYEYRTEEAGFRITVRNTANSGTIEEVPISWQIVVTRSDGQTEVVKGSETIKFLTAGGTREISTDKVTLKTTCKSLSSCPKCVSHAKEFTGDRMEGILIELENTDGEVIKDLVSPDMRERKIREALGSSSS